MKLRHALQGVGLLGLDTSPVIYFVEAHSQYGVLVNHVFRLIAAGALEGVTSVVSLTEVLTWPLRTNDTLLQKGYRDLLLRNSRIRCVAVDEPAAERAAVLRAQYNLRTPDAFQIAVALKAGCQAFLTNDRRLQRVAALKVLVLDELEL